MLLENKIKTNFSLIITLTNLKYISQKKSTKIQANFSQIIISTNLTYM